MRLGSVLSEAMRNIGAGTARAFLMFLAVLLTGGLMGGYEALAVVALEGEAATRIRADADVRGMVGGPVDGLACDRLVEADGGPTASGALRAGPQVTPAATPGRSLSSYEVTPGMLALIVAGEGRSAPAADPTGVWVPATLTDDFGVRRAIESDSPTAVEQAVSGVGRRIVRVLTTTVDVVVLPFFVLFGLLTANMVPLGVPGPGSGNPGRFDHRTARTRFGPRPPAGLVCDAYRAAGVG